MKDSGSKKRKLDQLSANPSLIKKNNPPSLPPNSYSLRNNPLNNNFLRNKPLYTTLFKQPSK